MSQETINFELSNNQRSKTNIYASKQVESLEQYLYSDEKISSKLSSDINNNLAVDDTLKDSIELNDGNKIPLLGLGTWNANGHELKAAIKHAIKIGYRHIDTATNYRNESIIGEAILECIEEGYIGREDLCVTTKLWNNSHSRKSVRIALETSLNALKLGYIDLYLVHYPVGYVENLGLSPLDNDGKVITSDIDYIETWKGMEDVKRLGLARSIGVSNFNLAQLRRLLHNCEIIPSMNQVECHPYLSQERLLKFCRLRTIELTAYSPLGSPGHAKQAAEGELLLKDPVVVSIAAKYKASASQVLIRYQLDRNIVVIPKAIQLEHIESNFGTLQMLRLSADDMQALNSLNKNHRYMLFERCIDHKYYPFRDCIADDDDNNI